MRLRALPPALSEPFLWPEMPWEGMIGAPTAIQDGRLLRVWYECVTPEAMAGDRPGLANLLCCAEGHGPGKWYRPLRRESAYGDARETNIVYGGALAGPWGYHGGSVFADPAAPEDARFKAIYLARAPEAELADFIAAHPESVSPWPAPSGGVRWVVAGAVSPDGYRWTRRDAPLLVHNSDTQNIAYYDAERGRYVAYLRTWMLGRRAIGRAEGATFGPLTAPETILWPGADVGPSDTWYGNARTSYPGAPDYHLAFPHRWHIARDQFTVHLLTSPDGVLWSAPPANTMLTPGASGERHAGGLHVGCGMVALHDRVAVPVTTYRVPHKYPRRPPLGEIAWAWWPRDRLVALTADEDGACATWPVRVAGNSLTLNARTTYAGHVLVELAGADGTPLPGRTFADCTPLVGDEPSHPVTWRGEVHLTAQGDVPLIIRLKLRQAEVFSLRFGE